jgi:hypothetical protein
VDPDARLLTKQGQTTAGYNVQIAVDSKHKLLVAVDVTQDGNDTQLLMPLLAQAQGILQSAQLTGLADAGYYNGEQLKQAEDQGIEVFVPVPHKTGSAGKDGRFTRDQFTYDADSDTYRCPNGNALKHTGKRRHGVRNFSVYKSLRSACKDCPLRKRCLTETAPYKKLDRWEHEAAVERHKARMGTATGMMKQRSGLVEHPFGTLKFRAGMHHFLMRGLKKCQGEFSLMALCYNFTRVLNLLGVEKLRDYCAQRIETGQKPLRFA